MAGQETLRDRDTVCDGQRFDDIPFGHAHLRLDGSAGAGQCGKKRRGDSLPAMARRNAEGDQLVRPVAIARRLDQCDADEPVTRNGA